MQGSDKFYCPDCDITVHQNDKENHLNGSKHKYRIRQKYAKPRNIEAKYQCLTCGSTFTNKEFYTVHMGSKTHRRNVRRKYKLLIREGKDASEIRVQLKTATVKVLSKDTRNTSSPLVSIKGRSFHKEESLPLEDECFYKGKREKFRRKILKTNESYYTSYICAATAYWALNLATDDSINDFKMSSNDKKWDHYGDVVIEINFKETVDQPSMVNTFAIQFKNISNNIKNIDCLDSGRFDFNKSIDQVSSLKCLKDGDIKKFIVFTTAAPMPNISRTFKIPAEICHRYKGPCDCISKENGISVNAKPLSNQRKILVNTSDDNENILSFFSLDNFHELPKIYYYTHQKRLKHFGKAMDELINEILDEKNLEIHRELIRYLEYWSETHYKLTKEDVLVKLGHMLLNQFKEHPEAQPIENKNNHLWFRAVNSTDVTVLHHHSEIIKIWELFNLKIEKEIMLKIDTTTNSIRLRQEVLKDIKNYILKMYIFEETFSDPNQDVSLEKVYDIFWKAGMIPLVLRVRNIRDQEFILKVISFLKSLGLNRRYLLITNDPKIKTSIKLFKNLTFFVTLDDVASRLQPQILDQAKISITETYFLSLQAIKELDNLFLKTVTASEFFDMALGKYSFRPCNHHLAKQEAEGCTLVLDDPTMNKLREEIYSKSEVHRIGLIEEERNESCLNGVSPTIFF